MGFPARDTAKTVANDSIRDMRLTERFDVLRHSLTHSETAACEYFMKHPESVYLSITDVVQNSGISYGSIMRLCRKLGCAGFQEFKVLLAQELVKDRDHGPKAPPSPFFQTLEKTKRDIINTRSLLQQDTIVQTVRAINKAHQILIGGIAGSASPAIGFEYKLSRLGLPAVVITEGYNMAIRAATLSGNDVFLAISFSGATKDILRAAEVARANGTTVICLTAFLKAPLVDLSDLCFFLSTNCEPLSCEVFSTIPCEFVLDILFSELCRIRKSARATIEKTFNAISDKRI
jgi:DNA-binding MurR/RpiR family transcriptional regulator